MWNRTLSRLIFHFPALSSCFHVSCGAFVASSEIWNQRSGGDCQQRANICLPAGYRNWFWSGLSPVGQDRKKTVDLRDYQKRSERYISIVEKHQVIFTDEAVMRREFEMINNKGTWCGFCLNILRMKGRLDYSVENGGIQQEQKLFETQRRWRGSFTMRCPRAQHEILRLCKRSRPSEQGCPGIDRCSEKIKQIKAVWKPAAVQYTPTAFWFWEKSLEGKYWGI